MSNFDSNSPSENEWDERGELAWNEFDWERYLREQDEVVHRYLAFYEQLRGHPDRVDEAAHFMGWDDGAWGNDTDAAPSATADESPTLEEEIEEINEKTEQQSGFSTEPYTLHKNPVFIATKAIYLSLKRGWELIATDPLKVPQATAISLHTSLYRGEEHALLGIQALDFGDYAMAISLFKRALRELNQSLSTLDEKTALFSRSLHLYREDAISRFFDLREIWLRVMQECRAELQRPVEGGEEDAE